MERFVRLVVVGGLALVAGLWAAELADTGSAPGLLGVLLAVLGGLVLLAGIWTEIDVRGR